MSKDLTAAQHFISFYKSLVATSLSLGEVSLINPFLDNETLRVVSDFYNAFFSDSDPRIFLFGINPGRLGAGITGIPFTDTYHLKDACGISHNFQERKELSSLFIYELISEMGGPEIFYKHFYLTSVCPLGFTTQGKNYNYYDKGIRLKRIEPFIIQSISHQVSQFQNKSIAFSLGKTENYDYLKSLNDSHEWFDVIKPLPHPRWIMQYQRKRKKVHLATYTNALGQLI